jgi:hypothetical protein
MMEVLTNKFGKIEIGKTAFYNFVREKCRITWKKAHFESVDRNCTEKLDERYDWVKNGSSQICWIMKVTVYL